MYAQRITDLQAAIASPLPDVQASAGRACKVAANALLGKVYLTMALTFDQRRQVLVVAHRADWRRESFGSRRGIKSATAWGPFGQGNLR